jgi:hypothetical protein
MTDNTTSHNSATDNPDDDVIWLSIDGDKFLTDKDLRESLDVHYARIISTGNMNRIAAGAIVVVAVITVVWFPDSPAFRRTAVYYKTTRDVVVASGATDTFNRLPRNNPRHDNDPDLGGAR